MTISSPKKVRFGLRVCSKKRFAGLLRFCAVSCSVFEQRSLGNAHEHCGLVLGLTNPQLSRTVRRGSVPPYKGGTNPQGHFF
jgi:hypothetical protein